MAFVINTFLTIVRLIATIVDTVTWPFWFIYYRPWQKRQSTMRAKRTTLGSVVEYKSTEIQDLTTSLFPECFTLTDLFRRSAQNYALNSCLGSREILREEDEVQANGRVFKKVILGEYSWLNYEEVYQHASHFGSGLQALGQKPRTNMLIFAETRAQWMIAAQACFKYNFPLVTLYATLGDEAIIHGINETEVTHIITSATLLSKFKSILPQIPSVNCLVYMDGHGGGSRADIAGFPSHIRIHSMSSVQELGARPEHVSTPATSPSRDDIAVIMYTSGSTGLPKGVLITHGNLMAGISGQSSRIPNLGLGDTYIAYLPLAHVLELSAEITCLAHGVKLGYSTPLTLTDQSSKIKKGSKGDATVLKPTLLAAVPSIMDRIYKSVWDKVNNSGPFGKELFRFACKYKLAWWKDGYDTPIINRTIFWRIRSLLGGHVRLVLSGGAPLSRQTQQFMNVCLCCPVGQGYGLTETCGAGSIPDVNDLTTGRVGAPLCCNKFMLRNWEEGNYLTTDKPYPRGEILIGGDNVTMGYLKNPEKTKEDYCLMDGLRWFCTGDIGQFHPDGCLQVIDRKKDLVKLQAGEYVSLTKVETCLITSSFIDNVCIYADSLKMFTVALIVPNPKALKQFAQTFGLDENNEAELCSNNQLITEYMKAIRQQAKEGRLEKFEIPQKIVLCSEVWTPDLGLVTESLKLKRKNIQEKYQCEIDRMYA